MLILETCLARKQERILSSCLMNSMNSVKNNASSCSLLAEHSMCRWWSTWWFVPSFWRPCPLTWALFLLWFGTFFAWEASWQTGTAHCWCSTTEDPEKPWFIFLEATDWEILQKTHLSPLQTRSEVGRTVSVPLKWSGHLCDTLSLSLSGQQVLLPLCFASPRFISILLNWKEGRNASYSFLYGSSVNNYWIIPSLQWGNPVTILSINCYIFCHDLGSLNSIDRSCHSYTHLIKYIWQTRCLWYCHQMFVSFLSTSPLYLDGHSDGSFTGSTSLFLVGLHPG